MDAVTELHNVVKYYGDFKALDSVSLTIREGITGLLGPNGAGKSTLIKVLLGLVSTTSGEGTVMGYSIRDQISEIRSKIGYMPEDDCYFHGLSGVECMQVAARLSRLPALEGLRRSHEILDFCGMGQERYRNVETFSTGMRQKLRFAMAIVHDPHLLILDEPTSGLDPEERESMLSRIRILAARFEKSIILCTHILPDVSAICQDAVIMSAGRVVVTDSVEKLQQPHDPGLTIQVMGDPAELIRELDRRGLHPRRERGGAVSLSGDVQMLNDELWSAAIATDCAVRSVTSSRNSMEEIFVQAVREGGNHANS